MNYTDRCTVTVTPQMVSAFQAYLGLTANSLNETTSCEAVGTSIWLEPFDEEADWRVRVSGKVLGFAHLQTNWDSYNGKPPSLLTCVQALTLVQHWWEFAKRFGESLPCPHVSAAGDGSISVEWRVGRKEVEIVVHPSEEEPFEWITTVNGPMGCEDHDGRFYGPGAPQSRQLVGWLLAEK